MQKTLQIPLTHDQVALIDASDFPIIAAFRWRATWNNGQHRYYATAGTKRVDGRITTIYMHRLITGCPKGKEVDHLNHDTLDNRRENLRAGSHKENMQNGRFALATHCPLGHPYDEANTYRDRKGRRCRRCAAIRQNKVYAAETPEQTLRRAATKKAYYERTRDVRQQQMREYADSHREQIRAYQMEWRAQRKKGT